MIVLRLKTGILRAWFALLASVLLHACGGGVDNGDSGKVPPLATKANPTKRMWASDVSGNRLTVNWEPDSNAHTYFIYETFPSGEIKTLVGATPQGRTSLVVNSLSPSTHYRFVTRSMNAQGLVFEDWIPVRVTTLANLPGALDTLLAGTGKVTVAMSSSEDLARAVAVQSDGKIVVAGSSLNASTGYRDLVLSRFKPNGGLDPTFGSGEATAGRVYFDIGPRDDIPHSLFLRSDGSYVIIGTDHSDWNAGVIHMQVSGSGQLLQSSVTRFGVQFGGYDENWSFAATMQPDGKIVASAMGSVCTFYSGAGLLRYNIDGSIDTTFGTNGFVNGCFTGGNLAPVIFGMAARPDGSILVAGCTYRNYNTCGKSYGDSFVGAEYRPDGSVNPAFGAQGLINNPLGHANGYQMHEVLVQADGKVIFVGHPNATADSHLAIFRFLADGSGLDPSYGVEGKTLTSLAPGGGQAVSAVLQSDGNLLVTGNANGDIVVARDNTDGILDNAFGNHGIVTVDINAGSSDAAHAIALQSDARAVAVGETTNAGQKDSVLIRFWR